MTYATCCPGLEKLVDRKPGEAGLGLVILTGKRGSRFFLEYRKDWQVPVAEAGIEIKFCPFCGRELTGPSSMRETSK
jgi:hypothetical protein